MSAPIPFWSIGTLLLGAALLAGCSDTGKVPFVMGDVGGAGGAEPRQVGGRSGSGGMSSGGTSTGGAFSGGTGGTFTGGTGGTFTGGTSTGGMSTGGMSTGGMSTGGMSTGGTTTTASCGDGVCSNVNGESYRTCASDCSFGCGTDWAYNVPQCDSCMRQYCCSWLESCDTGTSCRSVDNCRFSSCASATDLMSCMNSYCNNWGSSAFSTWQSYFACMGSSCSSACSK